MPLKIVGEPIPNLPWQAKPAGNPDVVWRYGANPIIDRRPLPQATGIYNSAVVPFKGGFVGVFRTEYKDRMPHLHVGRSDDGIKWTFEPKEIKFVCDDPEIAKQEYGYDPRLIRVGDDYYVMWCNGYHGPTIGIARTRDFATFEQLENTVLPYNRNGVLFPRKINGRYAMLSRPSDTGHTPFGDIFYSESPDLTFWGRHRHVMGRGNGWWQDKKSAPGPRRSRPAKAGCCSITAWPTPVMVLSIAPARRCSTSISPGRFFIGRTRRSFFPKPLTS